MTALSQELVKFDLQKMEDPEISGSEYQQGTLAGYELREYLLEKWRRTCAYCGKKDVPLQVEHIHPRSKGGSDRVSNLCLACEPCNRRKGNKPVETFLKDKPEVLAQIEAQAKAPLKDAAAVNATRWELYHRLQATGLPVETGSGGWTKWNRSRLDIPRSHGARCCMRRRRYGRLGLANPHPEGRSQGAWLLSANEHHQGWIPKRVFHASKVGPRVPDRGHRQGGRPDGEEGRHVSYLGRVAIRATGDFKVRTSNGPIDPTAQAGGSRKSGS